LQRAGGCCVIDERTFIRVHDGIEDHPKIAPLSDKAFRVLVTTWAWCSRHKTDGRVPTAVWQKRASAKVRAELETAGLVDIFEGHVLMHDYLKHQRSAEEIDEMREAKQFAGRVGNHKRWHVGQGIVDATCEFCVDTESQDPSQDRSHLRSQEDRTGTSQVRSQNDRKTSPDTDTDTEIKKEPSLRSGSRSTGHFEAFWSAYPRKVGKASARKAWPKACKKLEASRLVKAAVYWAGLWLQAGTDVQFIPHPATWLNGERWSDDPPLPRGQPTERRSTTDERVAQAQSLKALYADSNVLQLPGAAS
jgi:hypothetical protein